MMKSRYYFAAAVLSALTLASALIPVAPMLVWNATSSVPTGLYLVAQSDRLRVGDRVIVQPDARLAAFLARRGYVPPGVPLLKEVAALPGARVCRKGMLVTIDGSVAGYARSRDRAQRLLPAWHGCRDLASTQIFVMNLHAPGSFDGRYFGPINISQVSGRADPILTDEDGDGARKWFPERTFSHTATAHKGDEQ